MTTASAERAPRRTVAAHRDIATFTRAARPCSGGLRSLTVSPGDGGPPYRDMREAWARSVNGLWLDWIAKSVGAERPPELRAERARLLGGLIKGQAAGVPISEALMRSERWRGPLAEYADAVRRLVPCPFPEGAIDSEPEDDHQGDDDGEQDDHQGDDDGEQDTGR